MRKTFGTIGIVLLIGVLLFSGCAKPAESITVPTEGIAVGEPNPAATEAATDPAAGTSPKISADTARAMAFAKTIEDITGITLTDIEGNAVDRVFTTDEIKVIQTAFNESFIMDTAYIEVMAGNTMTIALKDGREVVIHSYGDPNYIVAQIGDESYHLGCETIGKILLEVKQ